MRKGFSTVEFLFVLGVLAIVMLILTPVFFAARQAAEDAKKTYNITNFSEDDITPGEVVYMVLNGRKGIVTAVRGDGRYWIRYADKNETMTELLLHPYEITEEPPPLLQGVDD